MCTLISLKQYVMCSGMSHKGSHSATRVATATSHFQGADVKGIRSCEVSLTYVNFPSGCRRPSRPRNRGEKGQKSVCQTN